MVMRPCELRPSRFSFHATNLAPTQSDQLALILKWANSAKPIVPTFDSVYRKHRSVQDGMQLTEEKYS